MPGWIVSVSPPPNGTISLAEFEGICITPAGEFLHQYLPALNSAFSVGEPARDHLYLTVNGIIPSELTWQHLVIPNSTHPGTAWPGVRTHREWCWSAEITAGVYEVVLYYPTETGEASFRWYFTTMEG